MMTSLQAYQECAKTWPHVRPQALHALTQKPSVALSFAHSVINGPFPEGEASISSQIDTALQYAQKVLQGPFRQGERILATDAQYAFDYAHTVLMMLSSPVKRLLRKIPITHIAMR